MGDVIGYQVPGRRVGAGPRNGMPEGKLYRYNGSRRGTGDEPERQLPPAAAARRDGRRERLAEYTRHREQGATVAEAAAAVGISPRTARAYEADRRRPPGGAR